MKNQISKVLKFTLSLLLLGLTWLIYRETSLNFTFLGIIALIFVFVLIMIPDTNYKRKLYFNGDSLIPDPPVRNPYLGYFSSILIVFFSALTFATLHNYFYADKTIYTNSDHHALRVEGVRIKQPSGFVLANNSSAFFDDKDFHGSVTIESVDTTANGFAVLSLDQFTHPIYHSVDNTVDTTLNSNGLISFTRDQEIIFESINGQQLKFWIEEHDEKKSAFQTLTNRRDSAYYNFCNLQTGQYFKSEMKTALVKGYSLVGLLEKCTISDIDFNGISIIRAKSTPLAKNYERISNEETKYSLDLNNYAFNYDSKDSTKVSKIILGDKIYDLKKHRFNDKITIPFEENIIIGYGDNKSPMFSFERDTINQDGSILLKYKMPYRQHLHRIENKIDNSLYVTSSLIHDTKNEVNGIGANVPDNVALFDLFSHSDNSNKFIPFRLSFSVGHTTESLSVLREEDQKVYSNDCYIEDIKSESEKLEWLIKVENLKETSPFHAENMLWIILLISLASIVISNIQTFAFKEKLYHRFSFSYAEFTLHIALIFFISFRCFILWRTSVFLPLENITHLEWNNIFRTTGHFKVLIAGIVLLYSVLAAIKIFILTYKNKNANFVNDQIYDLLESTIIKWCKWEKKIKVFPIVYIFPILLYVTSFLLAAFNTRFALVGVVLSYFVSDLIIYARSNYHTYHLSEINDKDERICLLSTFFLSILNMAIAAGCMFAIGDTGFVIMFATFCIFAIGFKIQDIYIKSATGNENRRKFSMFAVLYIVCAFTLLLAYKKILIWAVDSRFFIIGISIVLALAVWMICKMMGVNFIILHKQTKEHKRTPNGSLFSIYAIHAIIAIGLIFGVVGSIANLKLSNLLGEHTVQRINVLVKPPHDVLAMTKDNGEELRFLQASYNHWLIEEYHDRSDKVALFGEKGEGYFKIHPQSKLGALWNAQLTDIVILRYVITEHSQLLPIIFLLLFLAMLYYGIRTTTYYRFTRSILIQIPLLLLIQGMLVWMANTQRFIFFGQDFPFISITPKAMLIYVFVLLTLWAVVAVLESVMYRNHDAQEYSALESFNKNQSVIISGALFIILIICLIQWKPQVHNDNGKYEMTELYKKAHPYIAVIDSLLEKHQTVDSVQMQLKRNMHSQISEFNNVYGNQIDSLLKDKANKLHLSDTTHSLDTSDYRFPLRIWRNYVDGGSYNNSYNGLLHIHNDEGRLKVSIKKDYYDLKLPSHNSDEWKGNIIEHEQFNLSTGDTLISTDNYILYQLPARWVKPGESTCFIKKSGKKKVSVYSVQSNRFTELSDNGVSSVIALTNDDNVHIDGILENALPNGTHKYWARNILVNGQNTYIYPSGNNLFWIRDFATVVRREKNKQISGDKASEQDNAYYENVAITLDRQLTSDVFDIFEESLKHSGNTLDTRSVIIADGDGHIKALVDYKQDFNVDPNDYKMISDISEDLYMNYSNNRIQDESNWFENRNLAYMRGGPGSAQKPLVWNAVASQVELDWKNLQLIRVYAGNLKVDEGYHGLSKYNGETMKWNKYQPADELNGSTDIDLNNFLARSSNYYNALMVYMGLHDISLFQNDNFTTPIAANDSSTISLFRHSRHPRSLTEEEYREKYPFVKFGNNGNTLTLNHKISKDNYNKNVLHYQFTNVFGMMDHIPSMEESNALVNNLYKDYLNSNAYVGFTKPGASSVNLSLLARKEIPINSGMRNISLGGKEFWNITPLHMAEMYGKMITLNKDFALSFDPDFNYSSNPQNYWGTSNSSYEKARPEMFKAMRNFFFRFRTETEGALTFDGNGYGITSKKTLTDPEITVNGKVYYLYGKTGTSNNSADKKNKVLIYDENKDEKQDQFRRLAIIISDTNLHDKWISPDKLQDAKFYILFFTYDFKYGDLVATSRQIINTVLESEAFDSYMNAPKK